MNLRAVIAVMLAWQVALVPAAQQIIGTANAEGNFSVDNSRVSRHATLFEGNIVETAEASSTLDLTGGARLHLAAASKGRIFHDHLVLDRGEIDIQGADYRVEALALRIALAAPAKVGRLAADRIQVAVLTGAVRVMNSEGLMLASLEAGRVLEFAPQQLDAAAPSTVTGYVRLAGQAYTLTDEVTGVTVELRGSGIDFGLYAGKRVEAEGRLVFPAPVGGPAPQALSITTIKLLPAVSPAGSVKGKPGQATGSAAAGASHAVLAGVLITVVAAGAVAGVMLTREKTPTISPGR